LPKKHGIGKSKRRKKQGGAKRSGRWLETVKGQIVIDLEIWPDRTPFEH